MTLEGLVPTKAYADLGAYGYVINIFPLFGGYLAKLVIPTGLNAAYVFHPVMGLLEWDMLLGVAVTLGFATALYCVRKRDRIIMFCLLWVLVPLVPALYIPALGEHVFSERYLYLPCAGFTLLLSLVIARLVGFKVLSRARAGLLLISTVIFITALYSAGTVHRNPVWKDNLTLWTDTAGKSPDSRIARYNLGNALYKNGRIKDSIGEYAEAVRLDPAYRDAHFNLAGAYYDEGLIALALGHYKEGARLVPGDLKAHKRIAIIHVSTGNIDKAVLEYKEVIRIKPDDPEAHNNLAVAFIRTGRPREAVGEFREALKYAPDLAATRFNLGLALKILGSTEEARKEFEEALKIRPGFEAAREELDSLGGE